MGWFLLGSFLEIRCFVRIDAVRAEDGLGLIVRYVIEREIFGFRETDRERR